VLLTIQRSEVAMTQQMHDLIQEVKDTVDVEQSAILALQGIEAQLATAIADLRNAGADTAAIQSLKDSLSTKRAELAAAIATVPAPTPAPVPNQPPAPEPTPAPAPPAPEPTPDQPTP
jgi:ubiquinone biosynthesis protein Coq4